MSLSEVQIHDLLHQKLWDGVQQTLQDDSSAPLSLRTMTLDDVWILSSLTTQNLKRPQFSIIKVLPILPLWFPSDVNFSQLALSSGHVWHLLLWLIQKAPRNRQLTPLHFFFHLPPQRYASCHYIKKIKVETLARKPNHEHCGILAPSWKKLGWGLIPKEVSKGLPDTLVPF